MYDGNENEIPGTLDGTKELLLIDTLFLFCSSTLTRMDLPKPEELSCSFTVHVSCKRDDAQEEEDILKLEE